MGSTRGLTGLAGTGPRGPNLSEGALGMKYCFEVTPTLFGEEVRVYDSLVFRGAGCYQRVFLLMSGGRVLRTMFGPVQRLI